MNTEVKNWNRTSATVWLGRVLSGLAIAFLLLDAAIKLPPIQPVYDSLNELGFHTTPMLARSLGALLIACTALYTVPRTSLLGAVLLTGYLGGAMAVHVRADSPLFTHILFGAHVGLFVWTGLLLRSKVALRALLGL